MKGNHHDTSTHDNRAKEVAELMADTEDRVWELVHELMPMCDCCGKEQLRPGASRLIYVGVCTSCSHIKVLNSEWVRQTVAKAEVMADNDLEGQT